VFIDHKGKRKAKCVGSKQAAETAAKKIEAKLTLGDFSLLEENKPRSPTLAEYAAQWLRTYATVHCKPATVFNYERDYRLHVAPILGEKKLTEITRQDLKQLIADKRNSGLSWSSVKNIIIPLREMLNHAVEDGLLVANPATRIGRFNKKPAERRQNVNPLTREELRFFLDSARQYTPRYYPFLLALARAGLRLGEALALQWGDIDWHGRFMEIQRAYCHRSRKIQSPKNGKTRRVDMSQQLTDTLKALLVERKKDTLLNGWGEVPLLVFVSERGIILDGDHIRGRAFRTVLKKAGLRHIRIHDLRHTFASLLIQNGEFLAYVKEQMGHHSIQVTVDTYGHLVPGGNCQAVDKLDDPEHVPGATIRNLPATMTHDSVLEEPLSA